MRACVQCGLSVGETATFCPVCGARFDPSAGTEALEACTRTVEAPTSIPGAGDADRWDLAQPYESGTELVADLSDEQIGAGDLTLDAYEAGEVEETTPADAEADAALDVEPAPEAEPAADAEPAPEPQPSAWELKVAEVAVLLDAAASCEDEAMPRAAALYQEAIVGCLDASEDPEALGDVDDELLRGFDGLSSLLARGGLAVEALGVVDEAASLGLLNGGEPDAMGCREALKDRREDLRRLLFADSSQL